MNQSRGGPFLSRSFSGGSNEPKMFKQNSETCEKPSFSSLFSNNNIQKPPIEPFPSFDSTTLDDDGVYLQISNLDQWYDESNLRSYLTNQLKPITPILSLTIETPSIAKVKVPSIQVSLTLS